ncbi:acyloxyacyl hydrolase [Flavobacteriaceae bacterium]|nr:acyloxyacyl hydrolase [Flavobacteriaceae bacterium]
MMRLSLVFIFMILCIGNVIVTQAQVKQNFKLSTEVLYGISAEANDFFPERDPQYSLVLGIGKTIELPGKLTAQNPIIGLLGMYTDLGNTELLGHSYALIPYVSFPISGKHIKGSRLEFGLGGTYFDTRFDPETNFFNQAVTTDITWAFRGSVHQKLWQNVYGLMDLGLVYNHQSNGHTKLPNQGLNSFLISLRQNWDINITDRLLHDDNADESGAWPQSERATSYSAVNSEGPLAQKYIKEDLNESDRYKTQEYLEARFGYGQNVLALAFNDLRPVRTVSITWGKTHKSYLRWGVGAFYRFYQHYHDYIVGNESLVRPGQEFEAFRDNPWRYASNFGVHLNGEVLLGHFGVSTQLGFNFYKPAYAIDWRINEGWDYPPRELPPNWVLGEYNTKYQLKKYISSRLGIRYYLWDTRSDFAKQKYHTINPFIGAHLNANLGQADFTELSFGVIVRLNSKG